MADLSKIIESIDDKIANAQRDAHLSGYNVGYNVGYCKGYDAGYKEANPEGQRKEGYKEGLKQGYDNGINEVEAYHVGYDEGYKAGREITKEEREQVYNHGLDVAWEYAEKVLKLKDNERFIIFGNTNAVDIFDEYSASEAIAKIKEYEEKERCKECKYPLMNPLCGVGNETCNRKQEYEEKQIEKSCLTCGHCYDMGNERLYCEIAEEKPMSCPDYAQWIPKQIEKNCNACEHKDDTDSSECYECVKDIQNHFEEKQIENDCEYREICLTNGTFACRECQNKSNYIPKPYIGYIPYHSKIKTEYDEETRSYVYTVEDNDDEISIDQAIDNLKKGYGIPYKHKTLTLAIKALRMMKEKSPIEQAYADAERNV